MICWRLSVFIGVHRCLSAMHPLKQPFPSEAAPAAVAVKPYYFAHHRAIEVIDGFMQLLLGGFVADAAKGIRHPRRPAVLL
jgi:hypothetical protein